MFLIKTILIYILVSFCCLFLHGQNGQGLDISILNSSIGDASGKITLSVEYKNTSNDTLILLKPDPHFFENYYDQLPSLLFEQKDYPYKLHISQDSSKFKKDRNEGVLTMRHQNPPKYIHLEKHNVFVLPPKSIENIIIRLDLNHIVFNSSEDYSVELEYVPSFSKISKEQYQKVKNYEAQIDETIDSYNHYITESGVSENKLKLTVLRPKDISTPKYFIQATDLLNTISNVTVRTNPFKIKRKKLFYDLPNGESPNPFDLKSSKRYYVFSDGYSNLYDSIQQIDLSAVKNTFPSNVDNVKFFMLSYRQAIIENGKILKEWDLDEMKKIEPNPKDLESKYYGKYYLTSTVHHETYISSFGRNTSSLTLFRPDSRLGNLKALQTMCWDSYTDCLEYAKKKSMEKDGKIILSVMVEKKSSKIR